MGFRGRDMSSGDHPNSLPERFHGYRAIPCPSPIRTHKQNKGGGAKKGRCFIDLTGVLRFHADNRSSIPEPSQTPARMHREMTCLGFGFRNIGNRYGCDHRSSCQKTISSRRPMVFIVPTKTWDSTTLFDKVPELEPREVRAVAVL